MCTFTAILTPSPDGTLHLPLPEEWQHRKIKGKAELDLAPTEPTRAKAGLWKELPGTFWVSPDFAEPMEDFGNTWNEIAPGYPHPDLVSAGTPRASASGADRH